MASVKWLQAIEAVEQPFDGFQQARGYHFRTRADEKGEPCTLMRVNCLMTPPGIPDFYSRRRTVEAGQVALGGRAWSGAAPIARVEWAVDGAWQDAALGSSNEFCWRSWSAMWAAEPGEHELSCRATDKNGNVQPLEAPWDLSGFGNNGVQRIRVTVRP
jgi:sulfane dehydrogenase subunit SoxC